MFHMHKYINTKGNVFFLSAFSYYSSVSYNSGFYERLKNFKENYRTVSILPNVSKFMKYPYINRFQITLEFFSPNFNVGFQ